MADGYVQVAPDSTGKKIDNSELTVGSNTVERQRVVLGDDAEGAALALVTRTEPEAEAYGLATREIAGGADANLTHELLFRIVGLLDELVTLEKLKG